MAVLTKQQVEFLLEESLKIRMENEELKREIARLAAVREFEHKHEYDRGYDDGHEAAHKAARELMKG